MPKTTTDRFKEKFSKEWWKGFGTTDDIDEQGKQGILAFIESEKKLAWEEGYKRREHEADMRIKREVQEERTKLRSLLEGEKWVKNPSKDLSKEAESYIEKHNGTLEKVLQAIK